MKSHRQYRLHEGNYWDALAVMSWLFISYWTIGLWIGYSFGILFQKLGLMRIGLVQLPFRSIVLMQAGGFIALILNTCAVALYWKAFRTTFTMIVSALSLPLVFLHGLYRRKGIGVIRRLSASRLLRGGWLQKSEA